MPDRLFAALKTAWDAANMANTFTGGMFFGSAPEDASWPHVEIHDLGSGHRFFTSGDESNEHEWRNHAFQVNIWFKEDESTSPVSQAGTYARTFDAWMQTQNRGLSVPASEGLITDVTCSDMRIEEGEDDGVYQVQLDYEARRLRKINA